MSKIVYGCVISPLDYKSDDFAVTLTLFPEMYKYCADCQHDMTIKVFKEIFDGAGGEYVYSCELTKKSNIHYHIYLKYEKDYTTRQIRHLIQSRIEYFDKDGIFGYFTVRTCYDAKNWLSYMHKQQPIPFLLDTNTKQQNNLDNKKHNCINA